MTCFCNCSNIRVTFMLDYAFEKSFRFFFWNFKSCFIPGEPKTLVWAQLWKKGSKTVKIYKFNTNKLLFRSSYNLSSNCWKCRRKRRRVFLDQCLKNNTLPFYKIFIYFLGRSRQRKLRNFLGENAYDVQLCWWMWYKA